MTESNSVPLQVLMRSALPPDARVLAGPADVLVSWAVLLRAQPPALTELYGGELVLVQMDLLRSVESRLTVTDLVQRLVEARPSAIAIGTREEIPARAASIAADAGVALVALAGEVNLGRIEREVNRLISSGSALVTQRAVEVQRELVRASAENRELSGLLQIIARATNKPAVIHDDAAVQVEVSYPGGRRPSPGTRGLTPDAASLETFYRWLQRDAAKATVAGVTTSPIGYTAALQVEKRAAGYLSLVMPGTPLEEFERLVLTYGAEVCAVQLAKTRAIATAVEQTRGDWIQMWLSGTSADDDMLSARAQQSGFEANTTYVTAVFRAVAQSGAALPQDGLLSFIRDDLVRRQVAFAIGQYVDQIVLLYPLEGVSALSRARQQIDYLREQLQIRTPGGILTSGISRPVQGLSALRDSYREAKDSLAIAQQLGDTNRATYYGDLKLYQLLLSVKDKNLTHLRRFYQDALAPLVEHDERKQADLIRTLNGFFNANGNLAQAAADLDVHRNTLVYRLDRIAQLTGLDLDDPENRLILHLALKVQRVLATTQAS